MVSAMSVRTAAASSWPERTAAAPACNARCSTGAASRSRAVR